MSGPGCLPFERLELIDDPTPRGGALNMALDEVLLGGLGDDPRLRIYRWERPAVSIGYFDPAGPVLETWPTREPVRRWTGGGVVEHGDDLTFSLLVPRPRPLAMLPAAESYRVIHAAVAGALERAGLSRATLQAATARRTEGARACFDNPVTYDLIVAGRKVAGGAQRRTRRGLLHQGSIRGGEGGTGAGGCSGRVALERTLAEEFGVSIERRGLTVEELAAARVLAVEKYGAEAWLRRF